MSQGAYPQRKRKLEEGQTLDDLHEARRVRLWIKRRSGTKPIFLVVSAMSSRTSSGLTGPLPRNPLLSETEVHEYTCLKSKKRTHA
jgi:hypothetical protein